LRGAGISPSYYEHSPWLLSWESRRKIKPKQIPGWLIPRLLVVFTRQLNILVTALLQEPACYYSSSTVSGLTQSVEFLTAMQEIAGLILRAGLILTGLKRPGKGQHKMVA